MPAARTAACLSVSAALRTEVGWWESPGGRGGRSTAQLLASLSKRRSVSPTIHETPGVFLPLSSSLLLVIFRWESVRLLLSHSPPCQVLSTPSKQVHVDGPLLGAAQEHSVAHPQPGCVPWLWGRGTHLYRLGLGWYRMWRQTDAA